MQSCAALHLVQFGLQLLQFLYRPVDVVSVVVRHETSAATDDVVDFGQKGQTAAIASAHGGQVRVDLILQLGDGVRF